MKLKNFLTLTVLVFTFSTFALAQSSKSKIDNPHINGEKYKHDVDESLKLRATRRISEEDFLKMSQDKNTIILDTRSARKFEDLHIAGAKHLNFSEITKGTLAKTIPNKNTRILIYCNNNFENDEINFPTKSAPAALNLSTFTTLYTYGYRNVYELGPLLNTTTTKLKLESSPK